MRDPLSMLFLIIAVAATAPLTVDGDQDEVCLNKSLPSFSPVDLFPHLQDLAA
jgi:hypothetical protein